MERRLREELRLSEFADHRTRVPDGPGEGLDTQGKYKGGSRKCKPRAIRAVTQEGVTSYK